MRRRRYRDSFGLRSGSEQEVLRGDFTMGESKVHENAPSSTSGQPLSASFSPSDPALREFSDAIIRLSAATGRIVARACQADAPYPLVRVVNLLHLTVQAAHFTFLEVVDRWSK